MTKRKILIVEDSDDDAILVNKVLEDYLGDKFFFYRLTTAAAIPDFLKSNKDEVGLILLDLGLPDAQGEQAFDAVRSHCIDIPVIILTGMEDHDLAVRLVSEGAEDFLNKEMLSLKPELIRNAVDFAFTRHEAIAQASKQAAMNLAEKDMIIGWMGGEYSMHR